MRAVVDEQLEKVFSTLSPHMRLLGYEVVSIENGVCIAIVPYSLELVGDATTGVLHGGVVTSLLDSSGGAAVASAIGQPTSLATLDLRIDYLRPSRPGKALHARVECYKHTRSVAFTRGVAYDGDPKDPVAGMAATYMLGTQSKRRSERP
jgi:uncharacterized protein (TIGR00369 family)